MLQEFTEEIQKYIYPYVIRLLQTEHLSGPEAKDFMQYCYGQVDDLRDQMRQVETGESKKEV